MFKPALRAIPNKIAFKNSVFILGIFERVSVVMLIKEGWSVKQSENTEYKSDIAPIAYTLR